ncbi:MAG: O-methyltransferase [Chloroflexi bacterium]|nr:O-methyltransferase [Chloroflexota bacterium]
MDKQLAALLRELEIFGEANDAQTTDRTRRMLNITPDTGEFLLLLVRALQVKRALEIGTSNGYSTLWLAHAVEPFDGRVTTLEQSAFKIEMARANFERAGLAARIDLRVGDASGFLRQTVDVFDLIFLDSSRRQYVGWWRDLQRILAPGGLLVADNAVSHASELADFVRLVRATPGYLISLVPVGNGEFLALKEAGRTMSDKTIAQKASP